MQLLKCREPLAPLCNTQIQASGSDRTLYNALLKQTLSPDMCQAFLEQNLAKAKSLPCDLPQSMDDLDAWAHQQQHKVGQAYAQYLARRQAGGPREYFPSKAHALEFLRRVAPTKLVDGAWLYGVLKLWYEPSCFTLVRTYLEELGDGVAGQNHVLIYRKLLASTGCSDTHDLLDQYFLSGAVQLALGQMAELYLPEVIGFNLGYEMLPLHLLISAYELQELGIDPQYFRLHITIDNGANGHAQKAVQAVLDNAPVVGDRDHYYQRVKNGYRLNELGISSTEVIQQLDLQQSLIEMLKRKLPHAQHMHSDHCKLAGKSINQWLCQPSGIEDFIQALQNVGWVKRKQPVEQSRFWRMISDEHAPMFGVFNEYELQLIHDWIVAEPFNQGSYKKAQARSPSNALAEEAVIVRRQLRSLNLDEKARYLIELLAPAKHASTAGLEAAKLFNQLFLGR